MTATALKTQGTELFYLSAAAVMTKVGNLTGVTGTGGANDQIEITNLDSIEHEKMAGLPNPGAVSVPIIFDPANVAHQGLYTLWQSGATKRWVVGLADGTAPPTAAASVITFPNTRTFFEFDGFIADFPLDTALNSKVESQLTIQRSGPKTPHWKV